MYLYMKIDWRDQNHFQLIFPQLINQTIVLSVVIFLYIWFVPCAQKSWVQIRAVGFRALISLLIVCVTIKQHWHFGFHWKPPSSSSYSPVCPVDSHLLHVCVCVHPPTGPPNGNFHWSLPALHAEHPGCDSLSASQLDCWYCRNLGILRHCLHVLHLCESFINLTAKHVGVLLTISTKTIWCQSECSKYSFGMRLPCVIKMWGMASIRLQMKER